MNPPCPFGTSPLSVTPQKYEPSAMDFWLVERMHASEASRNKGGKGGVMSAKRKWPSETLKFTPHPSRLRRDTFPSRGGFAGGASPAPTSVILVRYRWNMVVGDISAGFMTAHPPQKPHTIRLKNLSSSALVSFTLTSLPWGQ